MNRLEVQDIYNKRPKSLTRYITEKMYLIG